MIISISIIIITIIVVLIILHIIHINSYNNLSASCDGDIINIYNIEDTLKIVRRNKHLRIIGNLMSWSNIICGKGNAIRMKYGNISNMCDTNVTVGAGMTLNDVVKYLALKGKVIPYLPYITNQTIGGCLATASHGSSKFGTMSQGIIDAKLISPDGNIITVNNLDAIRTSLGNFVFYNVTLEIVDDFNIVVVSGKSTIENFVKMWEEDIISLTGFYILSENIVYWHKLIKSSNGVKFSYNSDIILNNYIHQNLIMDEDMRVEIEIGIQIQDLSSAIYDIKNNITNVDMFNDVLLLRFTGRDKGYMSMTYDRDTAFISMSSLKTRNYTNTFKLFERLMRYYNGRPHWGKINYLTFDEVKRLYPKYQEYENVRYQYDKYGKFNMYCKTH